MPPAIGDQGTAQLQAGDVAAAHGVDPFAAEHSEHIYMEDVFADTADQARTVSKRIALRNRARGIVTELTFYEEGFLRVREGVKKRLSKDYLIELRFVDAQPVRRRRGASGWLWAMLGSAILAAASYLGLPRTGLTGYALPAATLFGTFSAIALLQFLYRSETCAVFRTASGRAEILTLIGSFGCMSKARRIVRDVRQAVRAAAAQNGAHDERYLRAEMQAHYRLREKGVITQQACSEGTAQILARFG